MIADARTSAPSLPRVSTGIPGLDEVTGGGFLKSGVYILQGTPGAGKTILANHTCHAHAAGGGRVVYVTLLAESHARLIQHMEAFSFFDPSLLGAQITYISAFDALRTAGLQGVVDVLRGEMQAQHATLLVLDGLVMADSAAGSDEELKLFISDIQSHSTLTGCTTLLLASEHPDRAVTAEQTMVDGIVLLRESAYGPRRERSLEIVKFRGSQTLRGNHVFSIGSEGIVVLPRLESARRMSAGDAVQSKGLSSGVSAIDSMLDIGGYPGGGVTLVRGSCGSGKTSVALHFLANSTIEEPGLFFGFYESPEFLRRISEMQGFDPAGALRSDHVTFVWNPFGESVLDDLAAQLLEKIASTGARRVVVDGLGGFAMASSFMERGSSFLAALSNELRRLGVTTVVTLEDTPLGYPAIIEPTTISALADTVIHLSITCEHQVRRFAWIGKSRISRHDKRVRELTLGKSGLVLADEEPPGAG